MLTEELDVASAAFGVDYESPSQFHREYKRFFGNPPMRDFQAPRVCVMVRKKSARFYPCTAPEERKVCSDRVKREHDTFLPLLEHAIAYLTEFRVRINVGVQFL